MLSYQHAYHAGNHADILKHFVLCFTLDSLNKKDKPYTFFDTHSGSGIYDLFDDRAIKTKEAASGIQNLISHKDYPDELNSYLSIVNKYLNKNLYPGSPEIEKKYIRQNDFLILSELHPQEYDNLKRNIKNNSKLNNIQIHHRNGWEMLKALTPPSTKRGAVLIDPSYEELEDYMNAANSINYVFKKWSNGIFLLWYPLLEHREEEISEMINSIINNTKEINANCEILNLQLKVFDKSLHKETSLEEVIKDIDKKNPPRLYGSGMLVLNAPWKLKEESSIVIPYLENLLKR